MVFGFGRGSPVGEVAAALKAHRVVDGVVSTGIGRIVVECLVLIVVF